MKRKITFLAIASAVLTLSTALSAAAEPSTTDAQAQAGVLLTARSQFHTSQLSVHLGAQVDAQSQAGAIISGGRSFKPARVVADNGMAPTPARPGAQSGRRYVPKNADAQSMAATVLLGRGA